MGLAGPGPMIAAVIQRMRRRPRLFMYAMIVVILHVVAMCKAGQPFSTIFAGSTVAFVVFQLLALSRRYSWLFRYADHIYYLAIIAVLAAGFIFLSDDQTVSDFIHHFEAKRLRVKLAAIEEDLNVTRDAAREYERQRPQQAVIEACRRKHPRIKNQTRTNLRLSEGTDGPTR